MLVVIDVRGRFE